MQNLTQQKNTPSNVPPNIPRGTQKDNALLRHKTPWWRWVLYALVAILLLLVLAFGALFFYLSQHPEDISRKISQELQAKTGFELAFSSIDMALLPLPGISFSNVQLKGKDFTLDVPYATVTPSLYSLITGNFSLGKITLWRPTFKMQSIPKVQTAEKTIKVQAKVSSPEQELSTEKNPTTNEPIPAPKAAIPTSVALQNVLRDIGTNIPSFFYSSSLHVIQGNIAWQQANTRLQSDHINAQVKLGFLGKLEGEIVFSKTHILSQATLLAHVENFSISLSGNVDEKVDIALKSHVTMPNYLTKSSVTLNIGYHIIQAEKSTFGIFDSGLVGADATRAQRAHVDIAGSWDIDAGLLWHEVKIPITSTGAFAGDVSSIINFEEIKAELGKDAVDITASLDLGNTQHPVLKGHIDIEHLSLTQWFGFARQLPLGIRNALHNIAGELDFILDKNGVDVPSIQATATGASFQGTGNVKDWGKPIIFLDLTSDLLQLKNIYPEAEGVSLPEMSFEHEPLTPVPGAADENRLAHDSLMSVGFDIRIAAKKLIAWDLPLENIAFRCSPTVLEAKNVPKKHENAVTLSLLSKNFLGGNGNVRAVLYSEPSKIAGKNRESVYDITGQLRNVQAVRPVTRIVGKNLVGGALSLDTAFTAKGRHTSEILLSKQGSVAVRIEKGVMYSGNNKKTPFNVLTLAGDFAAKNPAKVTGATMPPKLQYLGKWRASIDMPDISGNGSWNGALEFAGKNYGTVILSNFLGSLNMKLSASLISMPHPLDFSVQGGFYLNTTKSVVGVNNGKGHIPSLGDMQLTGSGTINFAQNIQWSANVQASTAALNVALARINSKGESFLPLTVPQSARVQLEANYAKNKLVLDKIQLYAGPMHITGKVNRTLWENPAWHLNLHLNELDYDKYFSNKPGIGYTHVRGLGPSGTPMLKGQHVSPDDNTHMSWEWLHDLQLSGAIKIGLFRIKKLSVRNISTTVDIRNASLSFKSLKATLYDGTVNGSFSGTVQNKALHSKIKVDANGVDLLALTNDLRMGTVISGPVSVALSFDGILGKKKNILAGFNGTWKLAVGSGFMQATRPDGTLRDSPTQISSFSDNGTLVNGILQSQNFRLFGPDMQIRGKGNINLVNDTLDMRLVADLGYIVDIPVRYYGSMDDPKRSLNAGAVVIAAIGTLGTGVFDLLGGVFTTLFGVVK